MFVFWKIWRALFFCNTRFEFHPFLLLPTINVTTIFNIFFDIQPASILEVGNRSFVIPIYFIYNQNYWFFELECLVNGWNTLTIITMRSILDVVAVLDSPLCTLSRSQVIFQWKQTKEKWGNTLKVQRNFSSISIFHTKIYITKQCLGCSIISTEKHNAGELNWTKY